MSELNFLTIGKKIREKRRSLGLKQEYLAEKLDVNPSHISNIECGRANLSLTALVKIANVMHCSVDYFICEEYNYPTEEGSSIDQKIKEQLRFKSDETKEKILKIIDVL